MLDDPALLARMGESAKALARPKAAEAIARLVEERAHGAAARRVAVNGGIGAA